MKKLSLILMVLLLAAGVVFAQGAKQTTREKYDIVILVKSMGNGFFDATHTGAKEAAAELGNVEISYLGPTQATAEGQIEIIESLIAQRVDGIAISANDADALIPVTKKAMAAGIKVISFDSGINAGGRIVDLVPSKEELIGRQQIQLASELAGGTGDIAILSATAQATNQNAWIRWMHEEVKNHPGLKIVETVYGDDAPDKSYRETNALLNKYPNLKVIIAPTTVGVLASAQAVKDAGKSGIVQVTGLGLPSEMKGSILDGTVKQMALWNPIDLGYTSTFILEALISGKNTGAVGDVFKAGRMGDVTVEANNVAVMGTPYVFNKDNIEQYAAIF
ncbi:rhamnose ABC transporter substrate-binding protein [Parasphaerochaeta coccoides]|uniref:Rhamnose-binding protein n=1 Tax=Parasphaerochaeta coccoides (strain ATCC BAA-1237 / DSM 17374 / SPN1) TaxID=760011 RepID=F4GKH4_PARC1|nr:rhamnose ABC transporter substrate-binding protein [Parasphaerochaeta coccoides]AEC02857.1 rhamnose-binding protein [Parasphaerochaeta coccoides DSM 17374]